MPGRGLPAWGLLLFWLCLARPEAALAAADSCPLVWGVALEGSPITPAQLEEYRGATGLRPRLVVFFLQWPAPGQPGPGLPVQTLRAIEQANAVPCLTWEPMYHDAQGRETAVAYQDLLAGRYDAHLTDFARQARAWGKPIIVRLAHEMNLARYHWGTGRDQYGPQSPAIYQKMFRYVVDLCRRQGASNLRWAFCPNAESNPHPRWHGADWNTARAYYPGPGYVDIVGMDGYNWGTTQTKDRHGWASKWQSFEQVFGELRAELHALAPDKPLLIFETASAQAGGDRQAWVGQALPLLARWGVRALVWFQVNKEVDWRLLRSRDDRVLKLLGDASRCPAGPPADWP